MNYYKYLILRHLNWYIRMHIISLRCLNINQTQTSEKLALQISPNLLTATLGLYSKLVSSSNALSYLFFPKI